MPSSRLVVRVSTTLLLGLAAGLVIGAVAGLFTVADESERVAPAGGVDGGERER